MSRIRVKYDNGRSLMFPTYTSFCEWEMWDSSEDGNYEVFYLEDEHDELDF